MESSVAWGSGSFDARSAARPASCVSQSISAPAAASTRTVASVMLGPIPSPGMRVTGTLIEGLENVSPKWLASSSVTSGVSVFDGMLHTSAVHLTVTNRVSMYRDPHDRDLLRHRRRCRRFGVGRRWRRWHRDESHLDRDEGNARVGERGQHSQITGQWSFNWVVGSRPKWPGSNCETSSV